MFEDLNYIAAVLREFGYGDDLPAEDVDFDSDLDMVAGVGTPAEDIAAYLGLR